MSEEKFAHPAPPGEKIPGTNYFAYFPGNHMDEGGWQKNEKMPSSRYRYEDLVSE